MKRDATPGQISTAVVTPIEIGEFPIRCAELCGPGHAAMQSVAVVQSQDDFDAWVEAGGRTPSPSSGDEQPSASVSPAELFIGSGCGACHTLTDAGSAGVLAPALDGVGDRAASRVEGLSAEDYIHQSIIEPGAYIVDGYAPTMPSNFGTTLSENEINVLVEYLLTQ
ncbi:MAG: c-type cytochrome [Anaerolineales bacterium]